MPDEPENQLPLALLLDDNLLSSTRVQAQLEQLRYKVQSVRTLPDALEPAPRLIVINLGSRSLGGATLIAPCRQRFAKSWIVGFCGHLESEIRRDARRSGIDKIVTNEQAFSQLGEHLLQQTEKP